MTKKQILNFIFTISIILIFSSVICYIFFFNTQRTFNIIETYKIITENGSITYLNVCLPVNGAYQEIENLIVDGAADYELIEFDGWQEVTAVIPSKNSETIVKISYTVRLKRNVNPWTGLVHDNYKMPQQYVDSNNENIIELGKQLRGDNDYKTALNILNYVNKKIRTASGNRENVTQLTASQLLENPVGVCIDYAILMTALLRAENIPARMISGLSLNLPLKKSNDWNHNGVAHAWVEFFVDGKWHFADPTWNIFNKSDTAHLSYGTYESDITSDFQQNRIIEKQEMGFFINGAMSTPLFFMVYSTDENAYVIPRADVTFSLFK